jgi:hypothetical protein
MVVHLVDDRERRVDVVLGVRGWRDGQGHSGRTGAVELHPNRSVCELQQRLSASRRR